MSSASGVILAGEPDLTFWPKARLRKPGSLMVIPGGDSILSRQWDALTRVCGPAHCHVVTQKAHATSVAAALPEAASTMIAEPGNRGAFAALGLALSHLSAKADDGVVVALPWGLYVTNAEAFGTAISQAIKVAQARSAFVTVVSKPTYPEPDHYYLRSTKDAKTASTLRFAEDLQAQPGRTSALRALASEDTAWCSGILVFRASTWWKYLKRKREAADKAFQAIRLSVGTGFYKRVLQSEFAALEGADLWQTVFRDCATPGSRALALVECEAAWVLLTGWRALGSTGGRNSSGNLASGPVVSLDCSECILDTTRGLLVAVGLQNIAVVATDDVILVCNKDRQEEVQSSLNLLRANGMQRYL